jgi:outer membrane protein assembly factor BamB
VCGVRGTEFSVKITDDGSTKLAVKEGKVAVLPAIVDVDEIRDKLKSQDEALIEAVEKIEEAAPIVAADQELIIGGETLKETEEVFQEVAQLVEKIVEKSESGEDVSLEETEKLVQELTDKVEQTNEKVAEVMEPAQEISPESAEELKTIEKIKLVEIPVEPAAGKEITVQEVKPEIKLEKIAIAVEPADAEILINGDLIGKGNLSGLFAHGDTLNVLIRRESYVEKSMTINVEKDSGRLYNITLQAEIIEVDISIKTTPDDANIFLADRRVGRGNYKGTFEAGTLISFRIERDTYLPRNLDIQVTAESGKLYEINLEKEKREISISATPEDAEITLGGNSIGVGSFSGEYPIGEKLSFLIVKENYVPQTLEIEITNDPVRTYTVALEREQRNIVIEVFPGDAQISLDGKILGRGSYSGSYPIGKKLAFQVFMSGFKTRILSIEVPQEKGKRFTLNLTEKTMEVTIRTNPDDAAIYLDGRVVGRGILTQKFPLNRRLTFKIIKPGYRDEILTINMAQARSTPYVVTLKGKPIISSKSIFDSAFTNRIAVTPDRLISADKKGNLSATDRVGEIVWQVNTANNPNENSFPVVIGNNVFFSGSDEFLILNSASGKILTRMNLDKDYSHLFGRRVVHFGQFALFPTNNSIRFINLYSGETMREIAVPGGTRMTPAVYNGKLLIVNQEGLFMVIDPATEKVVQRIATKAVQPVALEIDTLDSRAYFAGRKGQVVCIDLDAGEVAWQRKLEAGKDIGIYHDLEAVPGAVFIFADKSIYGFSLADGSPLFAPIRGVSSPPLYYALPSLLYYGSTGGELIAADTSGRIRKRLKVKGNITTRPYWDNGNLIVGTDSGELMIINPDFIE